MKLSNLMIRNFQKKILKWWSKNKRDLPWRRTSDPYKILVSEVMLQQTQVHRVIPKYAEFIEEFPTVKALAIASPARIIKSWKGMGYNRRALFLRQMTRTIVEQYEGEVPKDVKELVKLPGLGRYTARAILVFAYGQEVALVDTNIRQIITHFFFHDAPQKESVIEAVAQQLLPKGKSWEWHQALMDFGAIELSKFNRLKRRDEPAGTYQHRRNLVPFRGSNRFYRGRILDRLREGEIQQKKLIGEHISLYDKPRSFMRVIIASLLKDGLIECTSYGILRLPKK